MCLLLAAQRSSDSRANSVASLMLCLVFGLRWKIEEDGQQLHCRQQLSPTHKASLGAWCAKSANACRPKKEGPGCKASGLVAKVLAEIRMLKGNRAEVVHALAR
eukprot:1160383-Pelagomonas_calceolata.AAC.5